MDRVDYETYETQNVYDSVDEEKSALPSQKEVTFFGNDASTPIFNLSPHSLTPILNTSQKQLSGINKKRKQQDIHCDRSLHLFSSCPWNDNLDDILNNDSQQLSKQPTGGQALCSAAKRHGNRKVGCH